MFSLRSLIRPNIQAMKPYSSARSEYAGKEGIFLDANENPYGWYNRYPDPYQRELKQQLSQMKSIAPEQIFIGNGSDEIIDLAFRIFCRPGRDKALTFTPTYGLYEVAAALNDVTLLQEPLNDVFQLETSVLSSLLANKDLKLVFICSPNNPTGNRIEGIEALLQQFDGIVIVDEAYIDFSEGPSFITLLEQYPNLLVLQTLSKAWGLAAARIGMAFASEEVIACFNKVKPPYNISSLNQEAALIALKDTEGFADRRKLILQQREWLQAQLSQLSCTRKIYPSDANFLLVEVTDANELYNGLVQQGVITRNRHQVIPNCIRITVGSPEENRQLIAAIRTLTVKTLIQS